jgi:predicted RNA-binding Zn-ribbon protein involved in translation (DUF1610 family)
MQERPCITCGKPVAEDATATCHRCGGAFHQSCHSCGRLHGMQELRAFVFLCRRCYEYMVRYQVEG